MRKTILAASLLFCSLATNAQISIESSDLPSFGDNYLRITQTIDSSINVNKASINTSWDFSWLQNSGGSLDTIKFGDPANDQYGDSIPKANLVQYTEDLTFYIDKNSQGFNVVGVVIDEYKALLPFVRLDSAVNFLPTPFTYLDSFTSNGEYSTKLVDSSFFRIETDLFIRIDREVKVINYGELKMPNDSLYEVIMVDAYQTRYDSTVIETDNRIDTQVNLIEEHYYEFYAKDFGVPLVQALYVEGTDSIAEISFLDLEALFTSQPALSQNSLSVFPNPCFGKTIELSKAASSIKVFDMQGKLLLTELNSKAVNISGLNKGQYILEATSKSGEVFSEVLSVQ